MTPGPASAEEIYRTLRGLIASGRVGVGEKLPTVRQAASDFGVSPGTAQNAYKMLEAEGLTVSRVGSGTRVAPGAGTLPADLVRHLRELVALARREGVESGAVVDAFDALWQEEAVAPRVGG